MRRARGKAVSGVKGVAAVSIEVMTLQTLGAAQG